MQNSGRITSKTKELEHGGGNTTPGLERDLKVYSVKVEVPTKALYLLPIWEF